MKIRKHSNGNEYIFSGGVWVRNFTKTKIKSIQLSHMFEKEDFDTIIKNEQLNKTFPLICDEILHFKKIVIVSDGFDFEKKQKILSYIPKDVCILAINRSLHKWKLLSPSIPVEDRRPINAYVVNNPYEKANSYLPDKFSQYYPTCVASIRSNNDFLKKYKGNVYVYRPSFELNFGKESSDRYTIDDYRNPICACIGLAYQFGVEKLLLFCCDDSFEEKREDSVLLSNGLYTYKPLLKSYDIVDANLYWLKNFSKEKIHVVNHSSGADYKNASYINEKEISSFFADDSEGVNYEQ